MSAVASALDPRAILAALGVLDWTNAKAGDPRAGLACTVSILRLVPLPPDAPRLLAAASGALRWVLEAGWRAGYRQVAGPSGASSGNVAPFYAWAGAWMERDLAAKLGRPGVWLRAQDLERIRRWTARWKRRAGVLA